MAAVETLTTTVSIKGQVILPKAIRQRRHWEPGTRLLVEDTPDGVLLKAAPVFAPTRPEDVAGMLAYRGPPKTLEEMDAAITAEVERRRARGDANIIVRYLTADHPEQFAKASGLIRGEDVYVCTTVLLETEWVLRCGYRFSRERIIAALAAFAGLPRVTLEDPALAATALDWVGGRDRFRRCVASGKGEGLRSLRQLRPTLRGRRQCAERGEGAGALKDEPDETEVQIGQDRQARPSPTQGL